MNCFKQRLSNSNNHVVAPSATAVAQDRQAQERVSFPGSAQAEVRQDLVTATAASSLIACLIMGGLANMPLALAPGMGLNAYFAYNIVGFRGNGNVRRRFRTKMEKRMNKYK